MSIQIKLENEGSDEELETDMLYSPQLALKLALTEWLGEFGVPHQYNSKSSPLLYPHLLSLCVFVCYSYTLMDFLAYLCIIIDSLRTISNNIFISN